MRCKNVLEFANLSGRKENKTFLMHLPESGHWSFDKEGFFDTENLMHPEPASGGVLLIATKAKRYKALVTFKRALFPKVPDFGYLEIFKI